MTGRAPECLVFIRRCFQNADRLGCRARNYGLAHLLVRVMVSARAARQDTASRIIQPRIVERTKVGAMQSVSTSSQQAALPSKIIVETLE